MLKSEEGLLEENVHFMLLTCLKLDIEKSFHCIEAIQLIFEIISRKEDETHQMYEFLFLLVLARYFKYFLMVCIVKNLHFFASPFNYNL